MRTFDYIVVGGGSAGAVIAGRLAEERALRVLLLEAGPRDRHMMIDMPAGVSVLHDQRLFDWNYSTVPQERLSGRRLPQPRGKVLGGSSSINGMIFIRGHAQDYDRWEREGAVGWSYADVLPYFIRFERYAGRPSPYRGSSGPVTVRPGRSKSPLTEAFLEAGRQAGFLATDDVNGSQQEGFGNFDAIIGGGRRCSSSRAYLSGAGANLTVLTGALTLDLVMDGRRVIGVRALVEGHPRQFFADREVILSAGAVNSPQILMNSGVGPADALSACGVKVRHDLTGVGANLHDHLEVQVDFRCAEPVSLFKDVTGWRRYWNGLEWILFHSGVCASNHLEAGAFLRSRSDVPHPDIQFHFVPMCLTDQSRVVIREHGFRTHVGPLRTGSRGAIRLRSDDPLQPPLIDPNHMSTDDDWREMRAAIALAREVFSQKAFDRFRGEEIWPGAEVRSPSEVDDFIRAHAVSAHHLCGSCRMGEDDRAVVDPECRVRGLERLRVVDASIMPSITSGNLHAPALMIGEKAADLILGRAPLPRLNLTTKVASSRSGAPR